MNLWVFIRCRPSVMNPDFVVCLLYKNGFDLLSTSTPFPVGIVLYVNTSIGDGLLVKVLCLHRPVVLTERGGRESGGWTESNQFGLIFGAHVTWVT